ncbi:SCO1 protein [Ceraceosorus guamensis]|uniref:SCO1 protein n=1 Tax=Ceraceosorus guamensis TaxID=1522189 RepID=A0A316W647_9BASI|nr:SCO1 protein [Ceraceosorus guamensis]PWN45349.1 SCO1 protein [Ceraceosorus guamensis]
MSHPSRLFAARSSVGAVLATSSAARRMAQQSPCKLCSAVGPSISPSQPMSCSRLFSTTVQSRISASQSAPSSFKISAPAKSESSGQPPSSRPSPRSRADAKARTAIGPFTPLSAGLLLATSIALFFYFQSEKAEVERRKASEKKNEKVGRPRIGGEFSLVMPVLGGGSEGERIEARSFTEKDLVGAWTLLYFGFTNCPDICPEELDKMGKVVDQIDSKYGAIINPIFITCDPARDTLAATSTYVSEFHPRMVGLTGSYEAVKKACKAFRVYFSTPPGADPSNDYLVDHSIFFYLMDPEGKFVDAFGRSQTAEDVHAKVEGFVSRWQSEGNALGRADIKTRVQEDESRKVPF